MRFCFKFRETVLQNQIQSFSEQLNFAMYNSIFPPRGSIEHKASVSELQDSQTQHGKLGCPYGFHVVSHVPLHVRYPAHRDPKPLGLEQEL